MALAAAVLSSALVLGGGSFSGGPARGGARGDGEP
jgi:hypothetical protein